MHYYLKAKNLFIGNTTTAVAGILEIKDGRIVNHMDYNAPVEGEVLDAGDKQVVPGFIDAHVHLYLSALIHLGKMKAVGGPTIDEVVLQATSIPEYNGWKIGIGWYASDFGQQILPTKEDLDKASTDVPICFNRRGRAYDLAEFQGTRSVEINTGSNPAKYRWRSGRGEWRTDRGIP